MIVEELGVKSLEWVSGGAESLEWRSG